MMLQLQCSVQISLRLLKAYSWLEAPNRFQRMSQANIHPRIQHWRRQPNLGFAEQGNIRGQDADDGQGRAIHADCAPQNIAVAAKVALPDAVAENGHLRQIDWLIRKNKIAAEQRTNPQAVEEI